MKTKFFFLAIATIAMLSIVGCEKGPTGSDDPDNPNNIPPVSFTLSSTIGVTLPAYYVVDINVVSVDIDDIITEGRIYHFSVKPGATRVFRGDSAKLFLGQKASIGTAFKVHNTQIHSPYLSYTTMPESIIRTKVEKNNNYSFVITVVQGINW